MDKKRIDYVLEEAGKHEPRLGAETEAIVVDKNLDVVHEIAGQSPTDACMQYIQTTFGERAKEVLAYITPDVTALTIEGNPPPLSHPKSTAAAQRLMSIIIDAAIQNLGNAEGRDLHTLHGAAWRPSNVKDTDISTNIAFDKQVYYAYQAAKMVIKLLMQWVIIITYLYPGEHDILQKEIIQIK